MMKRLKMIIYILQLVLLIWGAIQPIRKELAQEKVKEKAKAGKK